jgi:hypothetical protein
MLSLADGAIQINHKEVSLAADMIVFADGLVKPIMVYEADEAYSMTELVLDYLEFTVVGRT